MKKIIIATALIVSVGNNLIAFGNNSASQAKTYKCELFGVGFFPRVEQLTERQKLSMGDEIVNTLLTIDSIKAKLNINNTSIEAKYLKNDIYTYELYITKEQTDIIGFVPKHKNMFIESANGDGTSTQLHYTCK